MVDEHRHRSTGWSALAFESIAAGAELAELLSSPVYYGIGVPRGTRRPVLLLPGFLGSDD